jgi:hypothetical protein
LDQAIAEVEYREMRQQIADQAAEYERVDRKATALITPIGLLIGLAINARPSGHLTTVDLLLYGGLALLSLALLFGVLVIKPRRFSRAVPDETIRPPQNLSGGHTNTSVSWWRRAIGAVGDTLQAFGEPPADRRRASESQFFQPPGWTKATMVETLNALTEEWAAAWRANNARAAKKVRWLFLESVTMLIGTVAIVAWYAAHTLH